MIKDNSEKNIFNANFDESNKIKKNPIKVKKNNIINDNINNSKNLITNEYISEFYKNNFLKNTKNYSTDDKIIFLSLILEELYIETKLDKFKSDYIFLEKWLWTLSDKKKQELNINLSGNAIENRIKNI
jgi:hypothetical protein